MFDTLETQPEVNEDEDEDEDEVEPQPRCVRESPKSTTVARWPVSPNRRGSSMIALKNCYVQQRLMGEDISGKRYSFNKPGARKISSGIWPPIKIFISLIPPTQTCVHLGRLVISNKMAIIKSFSARVPELHVSLVPIEKVL
jgi:hypothetical protein